MIKKIMIGVGIVAVAVTAVPALKGPFNRWCNKANDALNAEYAIDNFKAEYVSLHEKKVDVIESINKFNIEKRVIEKKLVNANAKLDIAKSALIANGTNDLVRFNQLKDAYETVKVEVDNYACMFNVYAEAVMKLEKSLALIDANMAKAKLNVDTLTSKKTMLDTIKSVNTSVENLNGIGDSELAVNIEKIDDDMIRESIKLEALSTGVTARTATVESAQEYLDSL